MREAVFSTIYDELTPRQRKVLHSFLAGKTDEAIAASLHLESSTVRRHLANICKEFGLSNFEGEHYSYRENLIELIAQYKPELIHPTLFNGRLAKLSQLGFPGSPLTPESPLYINRFPIEERCANEILKSGALIRIRAPQGMGKTSLLNRITAKAEASHYVTIRLNLRLAEDVVLTDLDTFLRWFCINLSRKLNIVPQLDDYWDERFGSIVSCTTYMQAHLLEHLRCPLILALDEVDWLFEVPKTAQGFFAVLRSWHEEANNLEIWQQLRLIVAHSTEVYIPLNLHQSPFNVGLPVRLPEFTPEQVQVLAQRYGFNWPLDQEVARLSTMIGGQPYLVQLALYYLHRDRISLDEFLTAAPTQTGVYGNHLRRQWQILQDYSELRSALKTVIETKTAGVQLDPILAYKLESMGLVKLHINSVCVSCELYRSYFSDRLCEHGEK